MIPSVEHLAACWASIDELCASLTEEQWDRPTGCPGWTVQDTLSHLVDYEARALGRPGPEHHAPPLDHVKNPMGEFNEIGVDHRRDSSGCRAVLAEFRDVTAERLDQLRALDRRRPRPRDRTRQSGPGTVADMLTLRVMDTWSHEQDMRRALGRPGHASGPAAREAIGYFAGFLPYVVGKRAGAPEGASVVFEIGDEHRQTVAVVDGRGTAVDDEPSTPTVRIRVPATTFAALAGGRSDVPDDAELTGDEELGRRVLAAMGIMP